MDTHSRKAKRRAALSSVIAAVLLTAMKLIVGLATNSLGILSEAAHSALDLGAALMTFFAVNISDKPADDTHHYGHGKIEGISAFLEVLLLLITCGFIIKEACGRILGTVHHPVEVNIYSFAVMGISIIVDLSRSTVLYRVAKKHKSQALEADALHFSSDIFSSAVVIAGLIGYKFLNFPLSDALAAFVVSVLVIVVSIRLALRTIDVLLDRAPDGLHRKIKNELAKISDVKKIDNLRIRTSGSTTFADMRISVDSKLSILDAHEIASKAEKKIMAIVPDADVVVHIDPDGEEDHCKEVRSQLSTLIKDHRDMFEGYHNLSIIHHEKIYIINFHLLMKGDTKLEDVHEICDHLERDIKQQIKGSRVTIHVEPSKK